MTDDQPLMRFLKDDKFRRLLDPAPARTCWSYLEPEKTSIVWQRQQPTYGALWMARPHTFSDEDEGMFPVLNADPETYCREMARLLKLDSQEAERRRVQFLARNPAGWMAAIHTRTRLCGVSCWYQDSHESARMWDEYVGEGHGVVVLTTLKKFEDALGYVSPQASNKAARPMFATVDYVDRERFFLPQDGYYHLLGIKGEGFKHEREVRLIGRSPELVRATADGASSSLDEIEAVAASAASGFNLLIDLSRLVSEVRVCPGATEQYLEEVRRLLAVKGISPDAVRRSEITKS
jgi:hypothetical protein